MQYFLNDFWNFQDFHFLWVLTPRIYHENTSKNTRKNRESSQKHIIFSYLNFLEFQKMTVWDPLDPIYFVSYFRNYPPKNPDDQSLFWCFSMEQFWNTNNFDKMRNHKQILMKSKIFSRSMDHLSMSQGCCGILIFLANQMFRFFWSACIIGIYRKPICWTLGISKKIENFGIYPHSQIAT